METDAERDATSKEEEVEGREGGGERRWRGEEVEKEGVGKSGEDDEAGEVRRKRRKRRRRRRGQLGQFAPGGSQTVPDLFK